jgi:hypothetical protein
MDNVPSKMKVSTPLGDEEFSVSKNGSNITLEIFKGSADLEIIEDSDDYLVAKGVLTIPFDCIMSIKLSSNPEIGSFIYLTDPLLNEVFLTQKCVEV